jgi:glycyl-tRNA synthetase beta chain
VVGMTDFLLELRSEEIPARMQDDARQNLKRLFEGELAKAGLKADDIATYATPRRLALIAYGLPLETQAVSEETKGPKTSAPPQALEGFLRKTGLTQDQLVERDGVYFAVIEKAGRATADVLGDAIPAIIRAFPWPKSMRWGAASLSTESQRWVRPLQGIVALLGDDVVPCEIDGIVSGRETVGHRFHSSGPISITGPDAYEAVLLNAKVIVNHNDRERIVSEGAIAAAEAAGLVLVQDPFLVTENAGLTEWPVPMLGRFDAAFLDVPEEVIQLTARVNQKYFICRDSAGKLANAFVCTANLSPSDGGAAVIAGNEKVLAARLSDAKFFWEADLKVQLEDQAAKLSNIVFHEKLGSVADKVERVAKLARWLVESGIVKPSPLAGEGQRSEATQGEGASVPNFGAPAPSPGAIAPPSPARGEGLSLAELAETAARLCKADLVTGMVGEFPELQGIMGGYYARAQGEAPEVADAIRDHYKPVGQGDDVPTAPVTVAVSLGDKLDTLVQFFFIEEQPTGSRDPFALRRAALAILTTITKLGLRIHLRTVIVEVLLTAYLIKMRAQTMAFTRSPVNDSARQSEAFDEFFNEPVMAIASKVKGWPQTRDSSIRAAIFEVSPRVLENLLDFLADRLKVQQREAGVRHDLIDAVFALGGEDDLVRLLARVKALQAFVTTDEGKNLFAGYKRAANILKQNPSPLAGEGQQREATQGEGASAPNFGAPAPSPGAAAPPSPARGEGVELALQTALDAAEPLATAAIEREDFEAAMSALASLRAPIDAFFEGVMVNDPDPDKRAFRLGLLTRFVQAVHRVADFSKIEG